MVKQTTIGTIEHLKNPSLKAIREYYNTYYVPNNMGLLCREIFNPDELIAKIDKGVLLYADRNKSLNIILERRILFLHLW